MRIYNIDTYYNLKIYICAQIVCKIAVEHFNPRVEERAAEPTRRRARYHSTTWIFHPRAIIPRLKWATLENPPPAPPPPHHLLVDRVRGIFMQTVEDYCCQGFPSCKSALAYIATTCELDARWEKIFMATRRVEHITDLNYTRQNEPCPKLLFSGWEVYKTQLLRI